MVEYDTLCMFSKYGGGGIGFLTEWVAMRRDENNLWVRLWFPLPFPLPKSSENMRMNEKVWEG